MWHSTKRVAAAVVCVFFAFALFAAPSASAQEPDPYADPVIPINPPLLVPGNVQDPPAEPDEVAGVVQDPPLATTGSTVDTPVAIGLALIGAGGLTLFAARKRQEHSE